MKKNNNKGFTLVELIIVIAILAVLTVALAPQFVKYVDKARFAKDENAAASIESAVVAAVIDRTSDDDTANDPTANFTVTFSSTGVSLGSGSGATVLADVTATLGGDLTKVVVTNKKSYNTNAGTYTFTCSTSGVVTGGTWAP